MNQINKLNTTKYDIILNGRMYDRVDIEVVLVQENKKAFESVFEKVVNTILYLLDGDCTLLAVEKSGLLGVTYFNYDKYEDRYIIIIGQGEHQNTFLINTKM
ncbi:MAG: hypothetical protein ACRC23_02050 [Aeromonas jandaei]